MTPKRKPFAERADLALLEYAREFRGVANLRDPILAQRLHAFYGEFEDVSPNTLKFFQNYKPFFREQLVRTFWYEFGPLIKLLEVKARLCFGLPSAVKLDAATGFELHADYDNHRDVYSSTLKGLTLTPFRVDGEQRGFFDDIAFFDIPPWLISEADGSLDLRSLEPFMNLGTSVSFFFPAADHQRWYTFCKGHDLPPRIHCGKKLVLVSKQEYGPDVVSFIFGVSSAVEPVTKPGDDVRPEFKRPPVGPDRDRGVEASDW